MWRLNWRRRHPSTALRSSAFGDDQGLLVVGRGTPRNPGIQRLGEELEAPEVQGTQGAALDRGQVQAVGRRELEARPPERKERPAKVVVVQDSSEHFFVASLRHSGFSPLSHYRRRAGEATTPARRNPRPVRS